MDASWDGQVLHTIFRVTVTSTSYLVFRIIMFRAFFSIFFELGIPNLVCGCIVGWQNVMIQFCDLDLISRIILVGAYLIYYLREELKFAVWIHLWMLMCRIPFVGHCDLYL